MAIDLDRLASEATTRMIEHDRILHESRRPCRCLRCCEDVELHKLVRLARVGQAYLEYRSHRGMDCDLVDFMESAFCRAFKGPGR